MPLRISQRKALTDLNTHLPFPCSDSTPSYTYTFEKVAAGTYTIRLTAINGNNELITPVSTDAATTGDLIVGLPGQPRLDSVVGSVGRATITWRLPVVNPSSDPGVHLLLGRVLPHCWLQWMLGSRRSVASLFALWPSTPTSFPAFDWCNAADTTFWLRTYLLNTASGAWEQQGGADAIAYAGSGPWDLPRDLYAGVYRFVMFGRNVNGDGPDSDLTDPVTVGGWG